MPHYPLAVTLLSCSPIVVEGLVMRTLDDISMSSRNCPLSSSTSLMHLHEFLLFVFKFVSKSTLAFVEASTKLDPMHWLINVFITSVEPYHEKTCRNAYQELKF